MWCHKCVTMRYYYTPVRKVQHEAPSNSSSGSRFFKDLRPVFVVARLLGVLPVSGVASCFGSRATHRWLSLPTVICILAIAGSGAMTFCSFRGVFLNRSNAGNARDIFVYLSTPIFYLSSFTTSLACLRLGRRIPQLANSYDDVTRRLAKYGSGGRRYSAYVVVGVVYSASISHYFSRIYVNGCYPPYHLRYDLYAHLLTHLTKCITYLENILGSSPFAAFTAYFCAIWMNFLWNLRDVLLVAFSLELRHRFKLLADHLGSTSNRPRLDWKTIREDHRQLCRLTRLTNDAVSILILQSYASNVYHICLDIYNGLNSQRYVNASATYRLFTLCYFFLRTIIITLAADSFHRMAQKPLAHLHNCPSNEYSEEVQRFILQITEGKIYFTACQLFVIKRNLLLTIFTVIVTYELIVLGI